MDTKALRQKILDLAIHGKLVPQDPNDEPASVLLERIKAEKERLIKEGKIKRSKKSAKSSDTPHYPYLLPNGWEWCNLEDIVSFGGGKTPSMDNKEYWDNGNHLWVTSKDMKYSYITNSLMKITDKALEVMTIYEKGTLLVVTRSGILRHTLPLSILEKPATVNQDLKTISPHIQELSEYLYVVIKANEHFILKEYHKDGTTVDSIDFDKFRCLPIPLAPIAEQKRIIVETKRWFALIDQVEQGKVDLQTTIKQAKSKILGLAIHGKLVPQDLNDEPAIELLKRINPDFTPCDNGHYSSMIANGYYDYTNTNPRNGYVSGTNHQNPSLIINGGTFAGGLNTIKNDDGAQLVINDGTFTNMSQATVQNHHVAEIKGGTFNTTGSAQYVVDNEGHNGAANDLGQMTISGGTLNGKIYVVGAGASLAVTGGTFSDPSALLYLSGNANVKIRLNGDATCNGFKTQSGQSVELDLNNHVLTLAKPTVGSAGTETNSCQLLKGSTVTMKNGTLASDNDKIMIQNYCNLTLDAMTVKGLNALYVLSNNCGNILISNTTINAGTGAYAFDVCGYSTYTDGVKVTVKGTSIINGNVELSKSTGNTEPMELNIEGGTFNGNLVVDSSITNASSIINVTGIPSFKGTGWDSYKK